MFLFDGCLVSVNISMNVNREVPKRLAPTITTLRELFLKSGNLCAFSGCNHLIMNVYGVFVAEICHIEAAEPGGERFNSLMTNEQRRAFPNLMLMCHGHHKVTDDVDKFPVERLQRMKSRHEAQFTHPEKLMLDSIKDWTIYSNATFPINLGAFCRVLNHALDEPEKEDIIIIFNKYIERFQTIPLELRSFLSKVIARMQRMKDTEVVIDFGWSERAIYISDIEGAFRLSAGVIENFARQLQLYGVASICEKEDYLGRTDYLFALHAVGDWPFWSDIAKFCEKTETAIETYAIDMRFDELDDKVLPS